MTWREIAGVAVIALAVVCVAVIAWLYVRDG